MKPDIKCNNLLLSQSVYKEQQLEEKAAQIFKAVQGLEIDTAMFLLEWCSAQLLLHQKCDITPEFLQRVCEMRQT